MTVLPVLLACIVAAPVHQGTAPQTTTSAVMASRGGFFALSVADMKASAGWYIEKLGLTVVMQEPATGHAGVTVLEGGGLIVELIQDPEAVPLSKAAPAVHDRMRIHGLVKAGVIVDNFSEILAAFKERHVEIAYGPFAARSNQRANVIIRDNAGNLVQVFGR